MNGYKLLIITVVIAVAACMFNMRSALYWYYLNAALTEYTQGIEILAKTPGPVRAPDDEVKKHFNETEKHLEDAILWAGENNFPHLILGLMNAFDGKQDAATANFDKYLSIHKTDFAIPLNAVLTYKGKPDYNPFSDIFPQEVSISPQSAIMSGWVAFHRKDLDLTRNFLLRAKSASSVSPDYHYLLALSEIEAGNYTTAFTNLKAARTLLSSKNAIKNIGVNLDTFPVKLVIRGDNIKIERGEWIGSIVPYGAKIPRVSAEILYGIAVLNNVNKDYHRSLFVTEIIRQNFGESCPYNNLMPQLEELAYPRGFSALVENNCTELGIDPYFVFALIREESKFNVNAKSNKAAQGLMQITPETARWICLKTRRPYHDGMMATPSVNITMGCWYIKYLLNKFADPETRHKWTLAAYNAGLGSAERWMKRWKAKGRKGSVIDYIRYEETKDYVTRVNDNWEHYKKLYSTRE
jgi:soluble lytic murein transglycosylase